MLMTDVKRLKISDTGEVDIECPNINSYTKFYTSRYTARLMLVYIQFLYVIFYTYSFHIGAEQYVYSWKWSSCADLTAR